MLVYTACNLVKWTTGLKRIEHYWYSQNPVAWLLLPVTGIFCLLSLIRRFLYRIHVLKTYTAPVPVIVVGNINIGGTGKTPLIIELCQQIKMAGMKPGVISRGYGGQAQVWPQQVTQESSAQQVGDEPRLIALRTGCPVVVGPNRQADVELLLKTHDCDVILSDDGMQHYKLKRDVEIAVVDASRGFGNGFCLPSGPLREPQGRLQSVDMVILNGGQPDQTSFAIQGRQVNALNTETQCLLLENMKGQQVHAVAGIGNPGRFFQMLEAYGIQCICHAFDDHHAYQSQDFDFEDDLPVLMTEKDAVKCANFKLNNAWYVPIDIQLSATAQEQFHQILQQVCHG